MIRYPRLSHQFVDEIPEQIEPAQLYISLPYATAVHKCCCGCGNEVVTPFSPAQWRMTFDGESITLHPSVGSWFLPCRSHYVIRNGWVVEAGQWKNAEVAAGQARDRRARQAHFGIKETEISSVMQPQSQKQKSWLRKVWDRLSGQG